MKYNLAEQRMTPNIYAILKDRYLRKDNEGNIIETPDQMYLRVAKHIANGQDELVDVYYRMMARGAFHPNCLNVNTRIATDKGYIKLSDIGDKRNKKITLKVSSDQEIEDATEYYYFGDTKGRQITTKNGYSIQGKNEHLLRIINNEGEYVWKTMGELVLGDWIALQENFLQDIPNSDLRTDEYPKKRVGSPANDISLPDKITTNLATLLGLYCADGHYNKETARLEWAVDRQDQDVVTWLHNTIEYEFGVQPKTYNFPKAACDVVSITSVKLCYWATLNQLIKENSNNACVPEAIFRSGKNAIAGFLRGVFDGDGSVGERTIELFSNSSILISQVQELLLGLGIRSKIRKQAAGFRLTINKNENWLRFQETVGFISQRKTDKLDITLSDNAHVDVIPNQEKRLTAWYKANFSGVEGSFQNIYKKVGMYICGARPLNKQIIKRHPILLESPSSEFFNSNQIYEKVADISSCVFEAADLHVPVRNTYIAAGFVTHNSPTLVNANVNKGSLSACFVRSPEDNMVDIMRVVDDIVQIEKSGGGIGIGVSKIRPKGAPVNGPHYEALGPVNVLRMVSFNASIITQGSFRRGAHMGQLSVSHPDIREFIHCKDTFEDLQNFNISVQITDEFMEAVLDDKSWALIDPHTNKVTETVFARDLWQEICTSAHATGDPGIAFIDRVWETQPNPQLGDIMTSNPCGEEYLEDGNSCCLGSINLSKFVVNGKWDYFALDMVVHTAVKFLNGVIDVNTFPLQKLRDINLATRRIGLGIMGWADALIALGIEYDSEEAIKEARNIGSAISNSAWDASADLAAKDGAYPEWYKSSFNIPGGRKVRNSSVITIAPTGTISRLADCSSGIEPLFDLAWESNILWKDDTGERTTKMMDSPKVIRDAVTKLDEAAQRQVDINLDSKNTGSWSCGTIQPSFLKKLATDKSGLEVLRIYGIDPKLFRTALEISPEAHLRMQAAWQENTSNAVSKTINAPNDITVDDIWDIYVQAWKLGCKGVTVYRSGTRELEVLSTIKENEGVRASDTSMPGDKKLSARWTDEEELQKESNWGLEELILRKGATKRPHSVYGVTDDWRTGHGKLYATLNTVGNKPHEVFANIGKAGGCDNAFLETIARLISLGLQKGIDWEELANSLDGITCCPVWDDGKLILSPSDAIARSMRGHWMEIEEESFPLVKKAGDYPVKTTDIAYEDNSKKCQKCNGKIVQRSGCSECESCGYGKCD